MLDRRSFFKLLFGAGIGASVAKSVSANHRSKTVVDALSGGSISRIDRQKIKVIGVGTGGSNIVQSLWIDGVRYADLLCINTDAEKLQKLFGVKTLLIGNGEITYLAPERGRDAALMDSEKIAGTFDDGTTMAIIVACMGGGTGTGAAPVVARLLRQKGILTIAIIPLPFEFEGRHRLEYALQGLAEMDRYADTVIAIHESGLIKFMPEVDVHNVFLHTKEIIIKGIKGILDPLSLPGIETRTNASVQQLFTRQGRAFLGQGSAKGTKALERAISMAVATPYSEHYALENVQSLLLHIRSGRDTARVDQAEMMSAIRNYVVSDTRFMISSSLDASQIDEVSVSLMAMGFRQGDSIASVKIGSPNC